MSVVDVILSCGETFPYDFDDQKTGFDLLDEVRKHPKAFNPAPGRDNVFLAASMAYELVYGSSEAVVPKEAEQNGEEDGKDVGTKVVSVLARSENDPRLGFLGLSCPPFPPQPLDLSKTLKASGVVPGSKLFATFLHPLISKGKSGKTVPTKFVECDSFFPHQLSTGKPIVVHCCKDNNCFRLNDDGIMMKPKAGFRVARSRDVYGTGPFVLHSHPCNAAQFHGALEMGKEGYFTVRKGPQLTSLPGNIRKNGVEAQSMMGTFETFVVSKFVEGDDE